MLRTVSCGISSANDFLVPSINQEASCSSAIKVKKVCVELLVTLGIGSLRIFFWRVCGGLSTVVTIVQGSQLMKANRSN